MTDANKTASTAHKDAATEHKACAEHHMKAAECHDHQKNGEAKASSISAMKHCDTASKLSTAACGTTTK
jgi:hypothetical protein